LSIIRQIRDCSLTYVKDPNTLAIPGGDRGSWHIDKRRKPQHYNPYGMGQSQILGFEGAKLKKKKKKKVIILGGQN